MLVGVTVALPTFVFFPSTSHDVMRVVGIEVIVEGGGVEVGVIDVDISGVALLLALLSLGPEDIDTRVEDTTAPVLYSSLLMPLAETLTGAVVASFICVTVEAAVCSIEPPPLLVLPLLGVLRASILTVLTTVLLDDTEQTVGLVFKTLTGFSGVVTVSFLCSILSIFFTASAEDIGPRRPLAVVELKPDDAVVVAAALDGDTTSCLGLTAVFMLAVETAISVAKASTAAVVAAAAFLIFFCAGVNILLPHASALRRRFTAAAVAVLLPS